MNMCVRAHSFIGTRLPNSHKSYDGFIWKAGPSGFHTFASLLPELSGFSRYALNILNNFARALFTFTFNRFLVIFEHLLILALLFATPFLSLFGCFLLYISSLSDLLLFSSFFFCHFSFPLSIFRLLLLLSLFFSLTRAA